MQNHANKSIKKIAPVAVGAFAALMLVGAASEQAFAVAFLDLECGLTPSNSQGKCGWVGKGEVQNAFGWNNARLQQAAPGVDFEYTEEATYDVTLQWFSDSFSRTDSDDESTNCEPNPDSSAPPGKSFICTTTHEVTTEKTSSIDAAINADPRQSPKQFTGFKLVDISITESGNVPNEGDSCPNGGPDSECTVTSVEQTGSGDSTFRAVSGSDESNPIAVTIQ
jgi:hypothetical protein